MGWLFRHVKLHWHRQHREMTPRRLDLKKVTKFMSKISWRTKSWLGTSNSQNSQLEAAREGILRRYHWQLDRWPTFKFLMIQNKILWDGEIGCNCLREGISKRIHRGLWGSSQRCWSHRGTGMPSWKEEGVTGVSEPIKSVRSCNTTDMKMPIITPSRTGMQPTTAKRITHPGSRWF